MPAFLQAVVGPFDQRHRGVRVASASVLPPLAAARPAPQEILAERLARGEIEPDDYRQRLEALRDDSKR